MHINSAIQGLKMSFKLLERTAHKINNTHVYNHYMFMYVYKLHNISVLFLLQSSMAAPVTPDVSIKEPFSKMYTSFSV